MSNQHKHPTISFRISDSERKQIEARILASGMMKKDYFVRSCIYNRICVVGKKETIWVLHLIDAVIVFFTVGIISSVGIIATPLSFIQQYQSYALLRHSI